MEPAEKDIIIEKIEKLSPEQVSKVLIFIAGLEAGSQIIQRPEPEKARQ